MSESENEQLKQRRAKNGTALKEWMNAKGITVEEFCKVVGVSRATVFGWRAGSFPPSRSKSTLLAKLTNDAVPAEGWD